MNIIDINDNKFNDLKPMKLDKHILNHESKLFRLKESNSLLKVFPSLNEDVVMNKLYTVITILENLYLMDSECLVLPNGVATNNYEMIGYVMPYIRNINFQTILNIMEISDEEKAYLFKEIGEILDEVKRIREVNHLDNFYLNDLHESNFIYDIDSKCIRVVDIDGARIKDNVWGASKYLALHNNLDEVSKYKRGSNGLFIPSNDTDIYCNIAMIFNYFYHVNIGKISIKEYYELLDKLNYQGVSKEFLDIVSLIYHDTANINPKELVLSLRRI